MDFYFEVICIRGGLNLDDVYERSQVLYALI